VDVERSPDPAEDSTYGPCAELRPVSRPLVRTVINAALRGPPSFMAKMKLVETILTETLLDYCSKTHAFQDKWAQAKAEAASLAAQLASRPPTLSGHD